MSVATLGATGRGTNRYQKESDMMSVHCPRHGREVLLGHRQILGIHGRGKEMTVRWVCWCGHEGSIRPHTRLTAQPPSTP